MIKRGIVRGNLTVDSAEQRLRGLCPLMPEEVCRVLLAAFIFIISIFSVSFSIIGCLTSRYLFSYRSVFFFVPMAIHGTLSFTFPVEKSLVGRRN